MINRRLAYLAALLVMLSLVWMSPPVSAQLLGLDLPGSLVVTITSPTSGSTVSGTITVRADVSIVGSLTVAGVQFHLDGTPLGAEDTSAPYLIPWNTIATRNGSHTLSAVARDVLGVQYTSDPVTVTVFNDTTPPRVTITTPPAGATVSGTVTVAADGSDSVGVAGVQFFVDGALLGAEDTAAPFAVSWDTTTVSNGTHTLTARARDAAGNVGFSERVTVAVSNAPPPDTTPPSARVTSPLSGSTVSGTIAVSAGATDDVGVAGVQFFVDGATLGAEDTVAPYAVSWDTTTVSNGSHRLMARARDAAGNVGFSERVTVAVSNALPDTTPPSVRVTSPLSGSTVSGAIAVSADATDGVGVAGVQFFVDGAVLGTEVTTAPYTISWDTTAVPDGSHTLTAVARDAAGNRATSDPVTVTVLNGPPPDMSPPAVAITAPADGATVSGTIAVGADASDDTGVAGVQFFVDGAPLGAEDTVAPYAVSWDTATVADGPHTLAAVARDTVGNTTTSSPVGVTVSNEAPPPSTVTRVEETDPAVTYSGEWAHGNMSFPWSGGTASFARGPGAQASFTFTGTRVTWIGWREPRGGIARVSLDGVFVAEIDLHSDTAAIQEPVFTSDVLAETSHTLVIEVTGRANPAATDTIVVVDAFEVTSSSSAPPPPPETVTRIEETDASVSFAGAWSRDETTFAWSGGTAAFSRGPGAQASLRFNGTRVTWIGWREPRAGIARVFLDGALVATVDLYAATAAIQEPVFTSEVLPAGDHTLVIEATGTANAAAADTIVVVDAFDVTGSSSAPPPPPSGTVTRFEETSPSIVYTTGWNAESTLPWSGGTATYTASIGSRATFTFTGTGVSWIGYRGHFGGFARVFLDGEAVAEIDTFSTTEQVSTVVYATEALAPGSHTLTVELLEKKNPDATSTEIAVDAFDVRN